MLLDRLKHNTPVNNFNFLVLNGLTFELIFFYLNMGLGSVVFLPSIFCFINYMCYLSCQWILYLCCHYIFPFSYQLHMLSLVVKDFLGFVSDELSLVCIMWTVCNIV